MSETGNPPRRLNLKNIEDAESVTADSVGMELRAIRLNRGETIAQISDVLRIRKDMVEAIEHGRADLLPGQAYAVGFVRAYADYLRLDTPDVVRRYKAELAAGDKHHQSYSMPVPEDEQRFSIVSVLIILLCIGAAAAGAWYLAKQYGLFSDRQLTAAPTVEDTAGGPPPPDGVVAAAPDSAVPPAAAIPVTPSPQPTPVVAPLPAPEPVAAPPRPGGIVPPAPGETATPASGRQMGKSNADARIIFIARRPVLLTVKATDMRNTLYVNRTLEVGDSYRVPNKGNLGLDIADAGAVDVMLDGEFIGRAGADGAVIKDFALSPEAYGAPPTVPATAPAEAPAATPPADPAAPAPAGTEPAAGPPPAPAEPTPAPPAAAPEDQPYSGPTPAPAPTTPPATPATPPATPD